MDRGRVSLSTSVGTAGPHSPTGQTAVQPVSRPRLPATNSSETHPHAIGGSTAMLNNDSPSLPDWIQDAYESLEPHFETTDGLSRTDAHDHLLSDADHVEEPGDASYVIKRLLERGWLYEVEGALYKTE